ncbi:RecBCD enzyme subunit RecD [Deltaproteobacteria bacterium]|nr:RecBCD enzyme subunit RecD [Deltaproteobacteria bacterium]
MSLTIEALLEAGRISSLDVAFADFVSRHGGTRADPLVALAAAAVSNHTAMGHVCLPLATIAGTAVLDEAGEDDGADATEETSALAGVCWPPGEVWLAALRDSRCVSDGNTLTPLVLDTTGRLYLHRYWEHEQRVTGWLNDRVSEPPTPLDEPWFASAIGRLFPPEAGSNGANASTPDPDWRKLAALLVLTRRFTVISGGPGTGKTTAVIRLLALMLEQAEITKRRLRIALVAPTGKAAARLQEAVDRQRPGVDTTPAARAALPTEATTIHRRLGAYGTGFKYGADNPIPYDVVVVDEASMVDLVLLSRLLAALEPGARLVLLGDHNQLASVQAGAVLGDLCRSAAAQGYSPTLAAQFGRLTGAPLSGEGVVLAEKAVARPGGTGLGGTGLGDAVVHLRTNFRFDAQSGIGALARATVVGDVAGVIRILKGGGAGSLRWLVPGKESTEALVCRESLGGYANYLGAADISAAYPEFLTFRVLCAHRRGEAGVETLNPAIEARLAAAGLIKPRAEWYRGRPVMVTQNDAALRLYNGDVGLAWPDAAGVLLVHFPDGKGGFRTFQPTRLPAHETVYAMTVHKSQGSEFGRVVLVLPEESSPVLTRELVYTGVTRAVSGVTVIGAENVLRAGVEARVARESGVG